MGNSAGTKAVGLGSNLSRIGAGDVRVNVVNKCGPFSQPAAGECETALVGDFWKDQRVVVHLLRRFG